MAKIDQSVNLPKIFRHNRLSILPVSRSQYVIGPFKTHAPVAHADDVEVEDMHLPGNLESIDAANLYSEAAALNCAYLAGIINDLAGEETFHTVSGRMSTEQFSFTVEGTDDGNTLHSVTVDNSQCEVDGGFEGANHFVLVEAKNFKIDDFMVRQLYYPYRLWSRKLSKRVVPVLMTFSNDIFDFSVYDFTDPNDYSSLRLVRQSRYTLAPDEITREDVNALVANIQMVPEPGDIPFPQADSFDRVVDLMAVLHDQGALTHDDITANYAFDVRQTDYYAAAGRYLGLVERYTDPDGETVYALTDAARMLMKRRHKVRYLSLIHRVLEHPVFCRTFAAGIQAGDIPTLEVISDIMVACGIRLNEVTRLRRARTVRAWIKWIWDHIID